MRKYFKTGIHHKTYKALIKGERRVEFCISGHQRRYEFEGDLDSILDYIAEKSGYKLVEFNIDKKEMIEYVAGYWIDDGIKENIEENIADAITMHDESCEKFAITQRDSVGLEVIPLGFNPCVGIARILSHLGAQNFKILK